MMVGYSSTPEFFFLDDMDAEKNYISVSIGEIWLYFYKQSLIGVRDMRSNQSAFLHAAHPTKPDGYSHRHEITREVVTRALSEPYPNLEPPKLLPADELTAVAIAWVANGMIEYVDLALHA
jgi:hypothetical protein